MKRPCIECGKPTPDTRCLDCARDRERRRGTRQQRGLGRDHEVLRAQALVDAGADERGIGGTCWLCGGTGTLDDPLTGDHVVPRSRGGTNIRENYRAAHRSCNSARHDDLAVSMPEVMM